MGTSSSPSRQTVFCCSVAFLMIIYQEEARGSLSINEPYVKMSHSHIPMNRASGTVDVGVIRNGPPKGAMEATVSWARYGATGKAETQTIEWADGESGLKNLTIHVDSDLLIGPDDDAIVAEIVSVSFGSIDWSSSSCTISAADQSEMPLFYIDKDAVFTPKDLKPQMAVQIRSGQVKGSRPAILKYSIQPWGTPRMAQHFSSINSKTGYLSFGPGDKRKTLDFPVEWKNVPEYASFHVTVELAPVFKAMMPADSRIFAAHFVGVPPGTCPAGSMIEEEHHSHVLETEVHDSKSAVEHTDYAGLVASGKLVLGVYDNAGSPVPLSWRRHQNAEPLGEIGAVVISNTSSLNLCLGAGKDVAAASKAVDGRTSPISFFIRQVKDDKAEQTIEMQRNSKFCANTLKHSDLREMRLWKLPLHVGPSIFRVQLLSGEDYEGAGSMFEDLKLNVLRKSSIENTYLSSLKVVPSKGDSFLACKTKANSSESKAAILKSTSSSFWVSNELESIDQTIYPCTPGSQIPISLDPAADVIQIFPTPYHEDVAGIRIEVNGQVLGHGFSEASASRRQTNGAHQDEVADIARTAWTGLPPRAYIVGLPQGVTVPVEIVVFADDETTSSKYTLLLTHQRRNDPAFSNSKGNLFGDNGVSVTKMAEVLSDLDGFEHCKICPSGTSSTSANASNCGICPPGTFALDGSRECLPCPAGSYSISWGSSSCKHCIEGTYSSHWNSTSCTLCPGSRTTDGDGKTSCEVDVESANLETRYAVVIHLSVQLTDIQEESVMVKAGVDASPTNIISNLIRADIASAFNTPRSAVNVVSMRKISDERIETNVSAALPVYIPPSASEQDISTALEVQRLSADSPIELLTKDPDAFFGRTTQILDAHVEAAEARAEDHFPTSTDNSRKIGLLVPGILAIFAGSALLYIAHRNHRRSKISERQNQSLLPSSIPRSE